MGKKDKNEHTDNNDLDLDSTGIAETEEQNIEKRSLEDQLTEELGKEKDKFLRLFAEFENYKRRTAKERIDLFKTANQDVLVSLLPVLDDFDRAYTEISKKTEEKELLKGVELISNKLKTTLRNKGLEVVDVNPGDVFNADEHEAITQIAAPAEDLKGKIIDVVEKGYK